MDPIDWITLIDVNAIPQLSAVISDPDQRREWNLIHRIVLIINAW
jgi:hypothetical protein